jgi:hypothetical protein
LAIDKYIKDRGYKIFTLVAFSGEVKDAESGPDAFTETSQTLNPNLRGRDIREAFDTDEYQILLVANKFQTGFDQPLLCGMYVDKRLAGIQAVQEVGRIAPPLVVAWVDFGQTAPEGKAFLVNRQSPRALIEVAAIDIVDGDVAFPPDAIRVGCKLVGDSERLLGGARAPNSCG